MLYREVFPQTASLQRIGIYGTSQCLGAWLVSCIPPPYTSCGIVKLIPIELSQVGTGDRSEKKLHIPVWLISCILPY